MHIDQGVNFSKLATTTTTTKKQKQKIKSWDK